MLRCPPPWLLAFTRLPTQATWLSSVLLWSSAHLPHPPGHVPPRLSICTGAPVLPCCVPAARPWGLPSPRISPASVHTHPTQACTHVHTPLLPRSLPHPNPQPLCPLWSSWASSRGLFLSLHGQCWRSLPKTLPGCDGDSRGPSQEGDVRAGGVGAQTT